MYLRTESEGRDCIRLELLFDFLDFLVQLDRLLEYKQSSSAALVLSAVVPQEEALEDVVDHLNALFVVLLRLPDLALAIAVQHLLDAVQNEVNDEIILA